MINNQVEQYKQKPELVILKFSIAIFYFAVTVVIQCWLVQLCLCYPQWFEENSAYFQIAMV